MEKHEYQQKHFEERATFLAVEYLEAVIHDYSGEESPNVYLRKLQHLASLAKDVLNAKDDEPEKEAE